MCGRFAFYTPPQKLKDLLSCENLPNFPPRYNAAPMQQLPLVIHNRIGMARWGFTPPWADADDSASAAKMINARSETVSDKPAFRESWHKKRRCLVPANGFFEWKIQKGTKQPYYIYDLKNPVFVMAGLWVKAGDLVTFTVLTKDADGPVASLHHRTPVIFTPDQAQDWLTSDLKGAAQMIAAAGSAQLDYHPVASSVGKVANDDESLIEEALPLIEAQASLL